MATDTGMWYRSMNLSPIYTAVVLSCVAHIGAFAVLTNTNPPLVPTNEIVFSSALQARLIQETQDAGETIQPSVAAIEATENKETNKASKANKRLQDMIQQVDILQKRLVVEHTQQLTLRNKLDNEKARNSRLQEAQQSLRDQFASLQSINRLQTQKIATLENQTALAVQQSQALLQKRATVLQEQHKVEEIISQLQTKSTNARFQHAQASSLLRLRKNQLAETHQSLKSLRQSNSTLVKQNLSLTTELSVFEVKHDALSSQTNDLSQHLETVNRENIRLSTEQEVLTERYLKLNEALDQSKMSQTSVLSELHQSDKMINTLSSRIEHMQSKYATLKDKLETLEQLNHHLENRLVTKSSVINTLRNDHRLQLEQISVQQANMLRESNAAVIQENSQLKIATKMLQTSLETSMQNNQSLENDRAELRTKTKLLNRQLTALRASHKELESAKVGQHALTKKPRSDSQTASALPAQQASKSSPDTGNAEIDFKAKQVAGNPKPVYPHTAYKLGIEGRVLIDLSMSAEGAVEKVHIRDSSGFAVLDSAAVRAVKKWRFYPVLRNGKAIPFSDTGHIIFKIKDS
tara:strand:+ start:417 stop:2153 length:1737 start_codon:yes stop_codon:yes gene_type:complete